MEPQVHYRVHQNPLARFFQSLFTTNRTSRRVVITPDLYFEDSGFDFVPMTDYPD
jgi:hypothetical protein